ncbi:UrcA family protein [Sphingomonas sp. 1P08PE]|uniref:UrcA family protein n=1 Tax=Sphingomonas sp. 1P08PE TaxID=554122 RepID=UPI0039A32065
MTINRSTIAAAVAAAACLFASPAVADIAVGREAVRVRIAHADLDLSAAAGRATLQTRIERAVRNACRSSFRGVDGVIDQSRCRAEMLRDADVQVAAIRQRAPTELAARR